MHLRTDVFELILEGPYIWTDQDDMRRVLRVFALLNDKSLRWAVLDSYIHTGALDAKERFVSDTEKIAGWCRENGVAVPFMISEEILSALDVENQS